MTGTGGATGSSGNLESALRETLTDLFRMDVRVRCYERGDALDVHVDPVGFASTLEDATDDDLQVSVYSDLKFTVAQD